MEMLQTTLVSETISINARNRWKSAIKECASFPSIIRLPLAMEPTRWAAAQRTEFKMAWSNRDDDTLIVGSGCAARVQAVPGESSDSVFRQCRQWLGNSDLEFFGGFSFRRDPPGPDSDWESFGYASFWLPRLQYDGRAVGCVVLSPHDIPDAIRASDQMVVAPEPPSYPGSFIDRCDSPSKAEWQGKVEDALELFRQEILEKVVLARRATFTFGQAISPIDLFEQLIRASHSCYRFCFQTSDTTAFLGASPERLFRRDGQRVLSEVIAGTRPRGVHADEDERLAQELHSSPKEQLEHDIVRKSIRQRLHKYVETVEVDQRSSILKLASKQHLYSGVRATLRPGVSDGQLLDRLHPTPAVGGYPIGNAMSEIARLERFDRGWYAAPVGRISARSAEFAVAIRSGIVNDNRLSLYSGAGIVPGSTPDAEWDEIEHKISDFLSLLSNGNR
jgi:menaquinone-specific isochorismate synthase